MLPASRSSTRTSRNCFLSAGCRPTPNSSRTKIMPVREVHSCAVVRARCNSPPVGAVRLNVR